MKLVPQQPGAREIKVKLMLAGGHAAMLVLPPEHPLLAQVRHNPRTTQIRETGRTLLLVGLDRPEPAREAAGVGMKTCRSQKAVNRGFQPGQRECSDFTGGADEVAVRAPHVS